MRFVIFTHSLVSDWNHGNAHFLRGIATELQARGHDVQIFEPEDGWSRHNLLRDHGPEAIEDFERAYPLLRSTLYNQGADLQRITRDADIVLVHEWNDPALIAELGRIRSVSGSFALFFHDTHHRSLTDRANIASLDLSKYDGVLAYGEVIRQTYLENRWVPRVWTWHEAADTRVFKPIPEQAKEVDLVWVGNWGDGERSAELREFLIEPVRRLGLKARVYGVRYPEEALRELACAQIEYCGWIPNFRVPEAFAKARVTVHVPRRPYADVLHGIPTIRPFEALACGIPLITAPWRDDEGLFRFGQDMLVARNGLEMCQQLESVLGSKQSAAALVQSGGQRVLDRHTCDHRVDQLLGIVAEVHQQELAGHAA